MKSFHLIANKLIENKAKGFYKYILKRMQNICRFLDTSQFHLKFPMQTKGKSELFRPDFECIAFFQAETLTPCDVHGNAVSSRVLSARGAVRQFGS